MCSCNLSSWDNGILLNKLFTQDGRLFNPSKSKRVLKRAESHRCVRLTQGFLLAILASFSRFFKGFCLENRLQNLNGVADFSQEKF